MLAAIPAPGEPGRRRCGHAAVALVLVLAVAGCGDGGADGAVPPDPSATLAPARAAAPALCGPVRVRVTGRVADPGLDELSGLATGVRDPRVLWSVEDSGAAPLLVGLRESGQVLTRAVVTGAENTDWEDVGTLDGPRGPEVVIADTGDNAATRDRVQVYRVPEPATGDTATGAAIRLDLRYPDGPHDAETLLLDAAHDELVLVTKAVRGARAYSAPLAAADGGALRLRRGPGVPIALATGGAVSGDGRVVAVRTYTGLALWRRRGRERIGVMLRRAPDCVARPSLLREGQGEAVALGRRGRVARTVPEGPRAPLRRYAARG